MIADVDLTPTEKLTIFSLRLEPRQTLQRLQRTTRTKTLKHLGRAVRTLRLAGIVIPEVGDDGVERYCLCVTKKWPARCFVPVRLLV
jgi:hypothetical protein